MNHYLPRQRATDQKWDYTVMNDGRTSPVGYCASEGDGHGHLTAKEAADCYKRYLLDTFLQLDGRYTDQQLKCLVCNVWTDRHAEIGKTIRSFALCDEHCTREQVEGLFEVWESHSSY